MFVGLLALPVALLGALPAGGWQLSAALPFLKHHATWVAHGPQLHRGVKVRVTGAAQGPLRPGVWAPVALTLKNPNSHSVQMNRVRVKVVRIVAPQANAAHPCTKADFVVRQMPRSTYQLPAAGSTDLAALGVPVGSWPRLAMRNRPANQDGCKGAVVKLRFKARGLHQ